MYKLQDAQLKVKSEQMFWYDNKYIEKYIDKIVLYINMCEVYKL